MISISEHKKTLETKGVDITDEEVGKLLTLQYKLANTFFDIWIKKTNPKVIIGGGITIHKENGNCFSVETFSFIHIYA